jgi:hypothetical protein
MGISVGRWAWQTSGTRTKDKHFLTWMTLKDTKSLSPVVRNFREPQEEPLFFLVGEAAAESCGRQELASNLGEHREEHIQDGVLPLPQGRVLLLGT